MVSPSPTSVQLPSYELGFAAAGLLLERIAGTDKPPQTVVLRTSLQARDSTSGPARGRRCPNDSDVARDA
ncbi:substrate-binding domain-containing protein [Streptomyces sp. NBC_01003]|nr:substrate-binding domain-containing protein [Streptomyces sp. NBC_01003]